MKIKRLFSWVIFSCSALGVLLALLLFARYTQLDNEKSLVGKDSNIRFTLFELETESGQWFLVNDLILGTELIYLSDYSLRSAHKLEGLLNLLESSRLCEPYLGQIHTLRGVIQDVAQIVEENKVTLGDDPAIQQGFLNRFDQLSYKLVSGLEVVKKGVLEEIERESQLLEGKTAQLQILAAVLASVYVLAVLVVNALSTRFLVEPVKGFTEAVARSVHQETPLKFTLRGPQEIRDLAKNFELLAGSLKENLDKVEAIFDTASSAIMQIDEKGAIYQPNHATVELFHYSKQELEDLRIDQLIPEFYKHAPFGRPEEVKGFPWKEYNETFDTLKGVKKEGDELDLYFSASLLALQEGDRIILFVYDVTQREELKSQLLQSQKMDSIGTLAAGVAHEINTPLQYISDNMDFIEMGLSRVGALTDEYSKQVPTEIESELKEKYKYDYIVQELNQALKQSLEGIEHVSKIAHSLKVLTYQDTGEKSPHSIIELIDNILTVSCNEWKTVAEVEKDYDPALAEVPCYPSLINQVFLNIIVNAAHALEEKGGGGRILIRVKEDKGHASIEIEDNGPGIPQKIINKVFDPFFTTKGVGKGTGQGLALCHSIVVEKHFGQIFVESEEGKTIFKILLPM